jgi:hypothetical protein
LREVAIPLSNRAEAGGHPGAHHLVNQIGELTARLRGSDGNRHDDSGRLLRTHRLHRGFHRRSGCEAVVNHHDNAIAKRDRRSPLAVCLLLTEQLGSFLLYDSLNGCSRDSVPRHDIGIENKNIPGRDRSHGQLAMTRDTELAGRDDIKWRTQRARDLVRHRYAAARQREHDNIGAPFESVQPS